MADVRSFGLEEGSVQGSGSDPGLGVRLRVGEHLIDEMTFAHSHLVAVASDGFAYLSVIKEEPLTTMPFAELKYFLALKGVDLQEQLDSHVDFMARMGAVVDVNAYRAKFQTICVRRSELENIPQGYKPMLFVDNMTPDESAKAFGVPLFGQKLSIFTKIYPRTFKPFLGQSFSRPARLTFIPNAANLTSDLTDRSADFRLMEMNQGKHFMEPAQWFQMFAECLDKAIRELDLGDGKEWKDMDEKERQAIMNDKRVDLYLPDVKTLTQFPDYRDQYGFVLRFHWSDYYRKVGVYNYSTILACREFGVRPSIG
ncbi:MAG: hypothetical protein WCT36_06065 [Candidatus Gracilibacteria bacterium]